jgi:acid phosphatase family membrane protein YuiD
MTISEYLYVPLITWATAQCIKFVIAIFKGEYKPSLLFSSGGMPSVHSATVSSLAMVALIEGGPASPLFGITGVFAAIVMYDSLGVRRAAGEQAKVLNRLIGDLETTGAVKGAHRYGHLREILGHRPLEVVIGAVLGVVMACVFLSAQLYDYMPWLQQTPSTTAQYIEIGLAVFLIVFGGVSYLVSRGKRVNLFTRYAPFVRQVLICNLVTAALLFAAVISQREQIGWAGDWVGVVVVLAIFFFWKAAIGYVLLVEGKLRVKLPSETEKRQQKWLKKAKKQPKRPRSR